MRPNRNLENKMKQSPQLNVLSRHFRMLAVAGLFASSGLALGAGWAVSLSGAQQAPPNTSSAKGSGEISVAPDGAVSGSITVTGMSPIAAHIHDGAPGKNGPVIVKLDRTDTGFTVPGGARLSAEQVANFKAGNTYINVHSEAFPPGEIRGQLTPPAMSAPRPSSAY